jgi:hypothetical protein
MDMFKNFAGTKGWLPAICLALWMLAGLPAQAQGELKDPLGKPEIWKQLVTNPKDARLWSAYFGKDLFELTKEEGANFRAWRTQLIAALDADAPTPSMQFDEDATLNQLTNNIAKNFMLIEDYFSSEFKKLGTDYVAFSDKYPDGNYNKVVWVEEQEQRLKKLRSGR